MQLHEIQASQGAAFAPDNIPLHFGDQAAEYHAALDHAVLLDRSHEARLDMRGRSAADILHRISTNDLLNLPAGEGRPTIFTNAHARILDRVEVFRRDEGLLLLGEPGRGQPLQQYLQRNIFFGDDAQLSSLSTTTAQFDLHGPRAAEILRHISADAAALDVLHGQEITIAGAAVYVARRKPVIEQRWSLIVPSDAAGAVWSALVDAGARPAGSLVYHVLRVRAGLPSVGRELSTDFIPLEVGLWDEVSFNKGCYTGQEIIARMESRNRLAKTLVMLRMDSLVAAPAPLVVEGRTAGQLTSSAAAPDGEIFALGVIKPEFAVPGQPVEVGPERIPAQVQALPEGTRRPAGQQGD